VTWSVKKNGGKKSKCVYMQRPLHPDELI